MKRLAILLVCGIAAVCCASKVAPEVEQKLRAVDIGKGEITLIERLDSGVFHHHTGKVMKNLPKCIRICYVLTPGKDSYIRCELWLPDKWNGRMWGIGNGGIAGNLRTKDFDWYMSEGDAAVTTDMGTSRGAYQKPDVWLDFAHRSTHLMTVTAKKFIKAYYGTEVKYSYFSGRSTGGGQGLHEAQRYPEDYDGILSEVPVVNRVVLMLNATNLDKLQSYSDLKPVFSKRQYDNLIKAAQEYYKDKDEPFAVKRGFLSYPDYSKETAEKIINMASAMKPEFTCDQKARLHQIYNGLVIDGKRVNHGSVFGCHIRNRRGAWFVNFDYYFDPPSKNSELYKKSQLVNVDWKYIMAFAEKMTPTFRADNPDLSKFSSRGGKIIIMSGVDDVICPEAIITDYVNKSIAFCGGLENFRKFARYYILPGRPHAQAESRGVRKLLNMKRVITDWVENGKAPEVLDGIMADNTILPVPPYPKRLRGDQGNYTFTDDGCINREPMCEKYW